MSLANDPDVHVIGGRAWPPDLTDGTVFDPATDADPSSSEGLRGSARRENHAASLL